MAITISGENNNDRILASDGVIDQLSGFNVVGVMTATSFTGDLTGDVTGNLTGNVTGNINNMTLLLQTGGTERIRITGNNEIGIAGANYGSSGQVLTSGGSGNAVTWSTITETTINNNANNRLITGSGTANTLEGEANLTFDGDHLIQTINGSGEGIQVSTTGDVYPQFTFKSNRGSNNNVLGYITTLWNNKEVGFISFNAGDDTTNKDNGSIRFGTSSANNVTERLRIESDGKVAVNQTSPTAQFQVGHPNSTTGVLRADPGYVSIDAGYANGGSTGGVVGSASNAALIFAGDADTGLYHSASDTLNFTTGGTERLRIASNGLVSVKTNGINLENATATNSRHYSITNAAGTTGWTFGNGVTASSHQFVIYDNTAGADRLRIASDGQIGMGAPTTYTDPYRLYLRYLYDGGAGYANGLVIDSRPDVLTTKHIRFYYALHGSGGGSELGSVTSSNAGSVSYNTSSDYRRKQNDVAITDGIAKVKNLRPIRFNWIEQPEITEEGFFAHEAQEVVPNSVFGAKDAVDKDGNPDYQVMDHSKLVPLLTASIKDLIAKVETLEAEVAALKGS